MGQPNQIWQFPVVDSPKGPYQYVYTAGANGTYIPILVPIPISQIGVTQPLQYVLLPTPASPLELDLICSGYDCYGISLTTLLLYSSSQLQSLKPSPPSLSTSRIPVALTISCARTLRTDTFSRLPTTSKPWTTTSLVTTIPRSITMFVSSMDHLLPETALLLTTMTLVLLLGISRQMAPGMRLGKTPTSEVQLCISARLLLKPR
jgi:hypothetical protein